MTSAFRSSLLFLFLGVTGLSLGSCSKEDNSKPLNVDSPTLTTGSWRLDQIIQNGQVTSSNAGIKDRYTLRFSTGGPYVQTLLADNSVYKGTWLLQNLSNNQYLDLTDHKGTETAYKVENLTPTELRYSFTNKANQTEVLVFSPQP